jgi:hypothetical protein
MTLLLGYHGCALDVAERLVAGEPFKISTNTYDWLGEGSYFFEDSPLQAWDYAHRVKKIHEPAVVGAVINPGLCANLLDRFWLEQLALSFTQISTLLTGLGQPVPENFQGRDKIRRPLDRLVIDNMHAMRKASKLPAIDSLRAVFEVGQPAFSGSGIMDKIHIQIAVRNPACIQGVFHVHNARIRPR